jgi:hypothetical protein
MGLPPGPATGLPYPQTGAGGRIEKGGGGGLEKRRVGSTQWRAISEHPARAPGARHWAACSARAMAMQREPKHEPTVEHRNTAARLTDDSPSVELAVLDEGTLQGGRARYGGKGTSPSVALGGESPGASLKTGALVRSCPARVSSCQDQAPLAFASERGVPVYL